MDTEKKPEQHGGIYNYFQGATIHNMVINGNMTKSGNENYYQEEHKEEKEISDKQLAKAIENCQESFWGNSSYAVVFCLFRDEYQRTMTQAGFEKMVEMLPYTKDRDYMCNPGTIANAFSDNPIFKYHVSKWEENGASQRILKLLNHLRTELEL